MSLGQDKITAHILNTSAGLGQETSTGFVAETSKLMATLVQMGVRYGDQAFPPPRLHFSFRTICFARYRQMVEIMLSRVRALMKKGSEEQVSAVHNPLLDVLRTPRLCPIEADTPRIVDEASSNRYSRIKFWV